MNKEDFTLNFNVLTDEQVSKSSGAGKHAEALFGGAVTGLGIGSRFGPWGLLGGGVIGGAAGLIRSYL